MNTARRRALRQLGALPGVAIAGRPAWLVALPGLAATRAPARTPTAACAPWPAWQAFSARFIGAGGRVVETADARQRTVSEAQAYALFFALVANQRELFERLLRWTEDNLAGGDLAQRLPAWHWGRRDDGSYGVIDDNSASDADLWLAHMLGEAGRLWGVHRYTALAASLAERALREEAAELPGLGLTLLPGARGFTPAHGRWRLNPSYLAPMQLQWLAREQGGGWPAVLRSSLQVLRGAAPRGLAPDWVVYDGAARRFVHDEPVGSYDAIRVYLWLGLSVGGLAGAGAGAGVQADGNAKVASRASNAAEGSAARMAEAQAYHADVAALLVHHAPMAALTHGLGAPPEKVNSLLGVAAGDHGPTGFSAALLPFLRALQQPVALRLQQARLQARDAEPQAYYEQVLRLFGQGALEGRYRFDAGGRLWPAWAACAAPGH